MLLPATTALGTSDPMGREKGILAGANVIMPNVSPVFAKKKYILYDGKICTDEDALLQPMPGNENEENRLQHQPVKGRP